MRVRQPVRTASHRLRDAIRQVSGCPALTGSLLLVLAPAGQAITLGDVNVQSALGQRLEATVPVRLEAGESLAASGVTTGRPPADELRTVPGATVSAPDVARAGAYELRVTSPEPLYEPMYALALEVQCPGTPILVRQYVLMLDLPGTVMAAAAAAPATVTTAVPVAATAGTPAPAARAARPAPARPAGRIESESTYRVAEGDTLSGIAARVQGRQVPLKAMIEAIWRANPAAFIRNDPNLIKLGSEISIPGALEPAVATVAPASEPVAPVEPSGPEPALPPVLESVPVLPATDPAVTPTVATVDATEAPPVVAPTATVATAAKAAAPDRRPEPATAEPSPFLAAGAGIVFGLLVSSFLWFRGRRPVSRPVARGAAPRETDDSPATAVAAAVPPLVTRTVEPGLTVSFTPHEDPLAAEFATDARDEEQSPTASMMAPAPAEDITSELEELFDGTDTTIQKRLEAEKTVAARSLLADPDGYTPPAATGDVDFLVGEPAGELEDLPGSTVEQPRPNLEPTMQSPTVDLKTLARSATQDQQQAQTLLEALTLLERDYEEELTASQVLDMSAVREALGQDFDDPTQISESRLREAGGRKGNRQG